MLPIFPSSNTDFIGSAHDAGGPYLPLAGGTMLGIIYGKGGTSSRLDLTELSGSKLQYGTLSLEVATNLSLNVSGVPKFAVDTSGNIQLTTTSKILFSPLAVNGDYIGSDGTNIDIIQSNNILARFPRSSAAQLVKGLDVYDATGAANQSILIRQNNTAILTGLTPFVVDGASAVAYTLDTKNTLANATAKLFALRNNTSEKVTVLASGFVGIGITSPTATLHINTGSTANDATGIKLKVNSAWNDWFMEVTGAGAIVQSSGGSVRNLLNPGGNSYITAGNVGIGTTIAATSTLQVVGDSNLGGFVVSNAGLVTAGTVPVARITGLGTMATAAAADYLPLTQSAIPTSFVDLTGATRGAIKKLDYTIIGPVTNTSNVGIAELFTLSATLGSGGGSSYYAKVSQVVVPLTNVEAMNAVYGEIAYAYHYGTGVLSNLVGKYIIAGQISNAGAVTTLIGLSVNAFSQSTAVVASQTSLLISGNRTNVGTTTDRRAININALNNSGTITDTYGIYIGSQTSGTQTNLPFSIYSVDAGAKMYHAGNVGIGTTSPANTLQVIGSARFGSASRYVRVQDNGAGQVAIEMNGSDGNLSRITTDQNDLWLNPATGTVKIGAVGVLLGTLSSTYGTYGGTGYGIRTASTTAFENTAVDINTDIFVLNHTVSGGRYLFDVLDNGISRLRIVSATGNVGIGATSPNTKLEVNGTFRAGNANDTYMTYDSAADNITLRKGGYYTSFGFDDANGFIPTIGFSGGPSQLIIRDGSLYVKPTAAAGLVNAIKLENTTGTSNVSATGISLRAGGNVAKGLIAFTNQTVWGVGDLTFGINSSANNTEAGLADARMTIQGSSGNVGIGTTTPLAKLQIEGIPSNDPVLFRVKNGTYPGSVRLEADPAGNASVALTLQDYTSVVKYAIQVSNSGYLECRNTTNTLVFGESAAGFTIRGFTISNAGVVTAGTVPVARLSGIVPTVNLGTGTANATTYLRGDQTWQPVSGGNNLDAIYNAMMN